MQIKSIEDFEILLDGDGDWNIIEEGDWIQDYKHQFQDIIVEYIPTGKFYSVTVSRSGSSFTGWEYDCKYGDIPDLYEVVQKERTIVEKYWSVV